MSSLPETGRPAELDFAKDPDASPARMNVAMDYIVALIRSVLSLKVDYQAAIDQLNAIGLERISIALQPMFEVAQDQSTTLQQIYDKWVAGSALTDLHATITAETAASLATALPQLGAALRDEAWFDNHG